jgi:hypothetical protein
MDKVLDLPETCAVTCCGRRGSIMILFPTSVRPVGYCGYHARPHLKHRVLDQEDHDDEFDADEPFA